LFEVEEKRGFLPFALFLLSARVRKAGRGCLCGRSAFRQSGDALRLALLEALLTTLPPPASFFSARWLTHENWFTSFGIGVY